MYNKRTTRTFQCIRCDATFERAVWHLSQVPLYCSPACRYAAARGEKHPLADRFWPKVDRNGPIPPHRPELGPCWVWTAARYVDGYGAFRVKGRTRRAHVFANFLATGQMPTPDLPVVTHLCDNGPIGCVRPSHLALDTQAGNMRGMSERGRAAFGERNGSYTHPDRVVRGEQIGNAKLTPNIVREIRQRYADGGVSQHALAAAYGVRQAAIWRIIQRKTWAHVI
jgi:hypothetical protein